MQRILDLWVMGLGSGAVQASAFTLMSWSGGSANLLGPVLYPVLVVISIAVVIGVWVWTKFLAGRSWARILVILGHFFMGVSLLALIATTVKLQGRFGGSLSSASGVTQLQAWVGGLGLLVGTVITFVSLWLLLHRDTAAWVRTMGTPENARLPPPVTLGAAITQRPGWILAGVVWGAIGVLPTVLA
jgi:hypothetical protein